MYLGPYYLERRLLAILAVALLAGGAVAAVLLLGGSSKAPTATSGSNLPPQGRTLIETTTPDGKTVTLPASSVSGFSAIISAPRCHQLHGKPVCQPGLPAANVVVMIATLAVGPHGKPAKSITPKLYHLQRSGRLVVKLKPGTYAVAVLKSAKSRKPIYSQTLSILPGHIASLALDLANPQAASLQDSTTNSP